MRSARVREAPSIAELRRLARRAVPKPVFDFIDGGADDEVTMRANEAAFSDVRLRPRVLRDVSEIDTSATILGTQASLPLVLAPTGLCGLARAQGELPTARAAATARVPFCVSCMSSTTLEMVAQASSGTEWFQIYIWKDRELTESLVQRAAHAGYAALVVTVDVPVIGKRERDARNGATIPPRASLRNAWAAVRHPRWSWDMLRAHPVDFANAAQTSDRRQRPLSVAERINRQFDPGATWDDLKRLRESWSGPLAIKGILAAADAEAALDIGVDGIIVSNHGGRQLDSAPASLWALAEIVDAVKGRAEILVDGGVRRGTDILKARLMGAHGCIIGRPYLYGLAAGGQEGVERAVAVLTDELVRAMTLCGVTSLKADQLTNETLVPAEAWSGRCQAR